MKCTLGQLTDFFEGFFWQDIVEELHVWREKVRDEMEEEIDPTITARLQGNAQALRKVIEELPHTLVGLAEEIQESSRDPEQEE